MKWRDGLYGGYKVPDLTKGWKASWFLAGFIFNWLAIPFSFIWYGQTLPQFPSVRKIAAKWSLFGTLCLWGIFFISLFLVTIC